MRCPLTKDKEQWFQCLNREGKRSKLVEKDWEFRHQREEVDQIHLRSLERWLSCPYYGRSDSRRYATSPEPLENDRECTVNTPWQFR